MKNIPLLLGSLVLILFISCGNDTVTNNDPVPGEEVIFSMDSFAINLENGLISNDTNIQIVNHTNCRVKFDVSTNVDSITSFALYRILCIDSSNTYIDTVNNFVSTLNETQTIYISGSLNFLLKISIQLNQNGFNTVFLRMKNLKITEIP